ncbi:uncharacterized protein B0H18DRAFT_520878 [Fomitopsis serialis]|uniref:uncharacterized protein n=1 Tax=Fomitopsis serialis TaxID=139415 RepID=UPI0020075251|nr:uncharacterized protein B0H18DRAFT_520878 [Neoantrodia serialis]KAH9910142.1 hypothetical protein B0H18DRAFT_520878 [Neoantrodia serialis]
MDDNLPSIDEWDENDMWETSTTIEESEFLLGRPVRKVAANEKGKGTYHRTSSGNTQGSVTIGALPEGHDFNAAERVRAWKRVQLMLSRHQGKQTRSTPVHRGF